MKRVLVVSLALHITVFAYLARTRPTPCFAPGPSTALEEVSIETETPPAPTEESPPPPAPAPDAPKVVPALAAARATSTGPAANTAVMPVASAAPSGSEPIAGANTNWIVTLGPGVQGPKVIPGDGLGHGSNPFVSRQQAEAEARAAAGPRKDDSLKGALMAQDAAKGLGPDGPVLHALEDETRSSLAPVRGNATFRAIVDATGTVTGLHLLGSTGDSTGWDDARARAFAALQKKKLELRGASGAQIDIRVESELRYPDGSIAPVTLSGDLSNLVTKPSRVVHARVAKVTPL